jgi:hypothetical protein
LPNLLEELLPERRRFFRRLRRRCGLAAYRFKPVCVPISLDKKFLFVF